ncbi:hypothetical protein H9I32_11435 [Bacillus sp. Xin]|uniref:hypothetical protein n=1 Tax=unclassified Bacillus (in: firmicutes) TaxID=185979 RepID=UPI0015733808|nr:MULTISPECIES: hypothetical protein [unclassified Bacillus (in: firmicutes)]MBC6972971.1 hypothetical protein [Bacillus sp. Xin]NSW36552.1 hypothetical protein [Bacillus sp. Xin1]
MSLNNGRNCNPSAISCSVPGSVSVPFPGSAPSIATTPQLFFTPLPPNPPTIALPENTSNITIMEFLVPARVVAERPRVQLDATMSTEIFVDTGNGNGGSIDFFDVDNITYQLFRNNTLLTDTIVSGNYQIGSGDNTFFTFNSTFTWVDTLHPTGPILPPDPILPVDPICYRIVANVGNYSEGVSAEVRNRGFIGVVYPPDPILPALPTGPI